jgi:hypothetical protein
MNDEIKLSSHGIDCIIRGDNYLIAEIKQDKFTQHHIPDLKIEDNLNESKLVLTCKKDLSLPVKLNYPQAKFSPNISSRDVVTVAEYMLERKRQEKLGYYTLSSATACKDDKSVTFWGGATHLGKTSSMLALIEHLGYNFFSDEKTLIDFKNKMVVGGSRSIPLRKDIIKKKLNHNINKEGFEEIKTIYEKQIPSMFIYPHLDHGLLEPIFYEFKPLDFFWMLTRELSLVIRGGNRFVDNFSYQLDSIDSKELTEKRIKYTKKFTADIPCYYFQGSLEQIINFIDKF